MTGPSYWLARNHPAYWAFVLHRVSGVALTLFLPFHFWALGLALHGEAALEGFIRWTDHPLVKVSEVGLVLLLGARYAGRDRTDRQRIKRKAESWAERYRALPPGERLAVLSGLLAVEAGE